jgi:hypothetical protein
LLWFGVLAIWLYLQIKSIVGAPNRSKLAPTGGNVAN